MSTLAGMAVRRWLDAIVAKHPNVSRAVFYEKTHADDRPGTDFDFAGRLDFARIADKTLHPDADYYLCGPVSFMRAQQKALIARRGYRRRGYVPRFTVPAR